VINIDLNTDEDKECSNKADREDNIFLKKDAPLTPKVIKDNLKEQLQN
jgi:hypothetical protein